MLKKILFFLLVTTSNIYLIRAQEKPLSTAVNDSILIKQDTVPLKKERRWKITGENSLTLNQSAFSNWVAGGNNSFGAAAKFIYSFNYKKDKRISKNKITLGYGQVNSEGEKPKKTDDVIALESMYGYQISKNWYVISAATLQTQIANGYDYNANPDYTPKDRKSSFMSPGYVTLGFGFEYKPDGKFQFSILPITAKATFVLDEKLQKKDNYGLRNDGDFLFMELGPLATLKYKSEIMKNITWEHAMTLFSNYITHTERVDIAYALLVNMKVNSRISTKLTFDLIYDHDQIKKVQIKQTFGVGFAYNFKNKE